MVQELLEQIGNLIKQQPKQVSGYNIFQVLEIGSKEVMMCRFLADLLNPQGSHKQGDRYLRSFLEKVLGLQVSDRQLANFRVYKEYPIAEGRRIDIVIQDKEHFIPIEVKIHAGDRESQCYDYYRFARNYDLDTKVVYLSKWGTVPLKCSLQSADGTDSLEIEQVICISFAHDIYPWLKQEQEGGPAALLIQQYLEAICEFTGDSSQGVKMEIADKLLEKEEYFRTGLEIEAAMAAAKSKLIYRVFQEFERQMEPLLAQYKLEPERRFSWYGYEEQATEYFYHCYSTYPGLNYVVKEAKLSEGAELWLRIEVEHNLFAGFCVFDTLAESEYGRGNQMDAVNAALEAELLQYLNVSKLEKGDWWLTWWYLPTGTNKLQIDSKQIPNFKEMNEAAIRLTDMANLRQFVSVSVEVIENALKRLLK